MFSFFFTFIAENFSSFLFFFMDDNSIPENLNITSKLTTNYGESSSNSSSLLLKSNLEIKDKKYSLEYFYNLFNLDNEEIEISDSKKKTTQELINEMSTKKSELINKSSNEAISQIRNNAEDTKKEIEERKKEIFELDNKILEIKSNLFDFLKEDIMDKKKKVSLRNQIESLSTDEIKSVKEFCANKVKSGSEAIERIGMDMNSILLAQEYLLKIEHYSLRGYNAYKAMSKDMYENYELSLKYKELVTEKKKDLAMYHVILTEEQIIQGKAFIARDQKKAAGLDKQLCDLRVWGRWGMIHDFYMNNSYHLLPVPEYNEIKALEYYQETYIDNLLSKELPEDLEVPENCTYQEYKPIYSLKNGEYNDSNPEKSTFFVQCTEDFINEYTVASDKRMFLLSNNDTFIKSSDPQKFQIPHRINLINIFQNSRHQCYLALFNFFSDEFVIKTTLENEVLKNQFVEFSQKIANLDREVVDLHTDNESLKKEVNELQTKYNESLSVDISKNSPIIEEEDISVVVKEPVEEIKVDNKANLENEKKTSWFSFHNILFNINSYKSTILVTVVASASIGLICGAAGMFAGLRFFE